MRGGKMAYRTLNDINKSVASDVESFIESAEEGFDSSVSSLVGNFISDCDCDIVLLAGPSSSGKTTTAGKIVEKIRDSGRLFDSQEPDLFPEEPETIDNKPQTEQVSPAESKPDTPRITKILVFYDNGTFKEID